MHTYMTGATMLFAHIWDNATKSNIKSLVIALLLISCVIGITFKSFSIGLLSIVPNFFPAIMAFGVWGMLYGQVDIGSSVVALIAFGIVVDDTIHFLHRYQHLRKNGAGHSAAIEGTLTSVGKALVTTTVVLSLGFGVLSFSDYTMNSSMGMLTALTISFALILDLFFLPVLLRLSHGFRQASIVS